MHIIVLIATAVKNMACIAMKTACVPTEEIVFRMHKITKVNVKKKSSHDSNW